MADVTQHQGSEVVQCSFCWRYELIADNWDVYAGYGYHKGGMKKNIVTPWELDADAKIMVEHHRVCGRTMTAGKLFVTHDSTLLSFFRCTNCEEMFAYIPDGRGASPEHRQYVMDRARRCCTTENGKLKS